MPRRRRPLLFPGQESDLRGERALRRLWASVAVADPFNHRAGVQKVVGVPGRGDKDERRRPVRVPGLEDDGWRQGTAGWAWV